MPLFLEPKNSIQIYLVHPPRTAGRFIGYTLEKNGWCMYNEFDRSCMTTNPPSPILASTPEQMKEYFNTLSPVEPPVIMGHLHREIIDQLPYMNQEKIIRICVIRDPVDRFYSALQQIENPPSKLEDIKYMLENMSTIYGEINHFRPQSDFIDWHTLLWKFEDGFGKAFFEWMNAIIGQLSNTEDESKRVQIVDLLEGSTDNSSWDIPDTKNKIEREESVIEYVKEFYKEDYEIFNGPTPPYGWYDMVFRYWFDQEYDIQD